MSAAHAGGVPALQIAWRTSSIGAVEKAGGAPAGGVLGQRAERSRGRGRAARSTSAGVRPVITGTISERRIVAGSRPTARQ